MFINNERNTCYSNLYDKTLVLNTEMYSILDMLQKDWEKYMKMFCADHLIVNFNLNDSDKLENTPTMIYWHQNILQLKLI